MRFRSEVTVLEMMYPFCTISTGNKVHIVLCCPGHDDLRRRYFEPAYFNFPSNFRLTQILPSKNERTLRYLAQYLYKSFNKREVIMSWSVTYVKMFTMDLSLCSCLVLCIFCILYLIFDFKVCKTQSWRNGVQTELLLVESPPPPPTPHCNRGYGLS